MQKNKLGFVDSTLPQPNIGDPFRPTWDKDNKVVLAWLVHALSPKIVQSVMLITKASKLWTELKQRFCQSNHTGVVDLLEELYSLKQGNLPITGFFIQLKGLWSELESFRPLKVCECGVQCICKEYTEHDFIMRFLKGLNDLFSCVRSQILLLDPLPPISRVYSLILQHERAMTKLGC